MIAIASLGALFAALAGFLVYCQAITPLAGAGLFGFVVCIAAMLKLGGGEAGSGRKALAGLLFALSLGCLGVFVWESMDFGKSKRKIDVEALNLGVFEVAKAEIFAKALVELAPGSKALLISGSTKENDAVIKAQLAKLKEVFGSQIEIVATESFPVEPLPKGLMPRYGLTKATGAKEFEAAIASHKDCNLVVSLVGLPREFWRMSLWRWNDLARPKMAFLEGDPRTLMRMLGRGQVLLFAGYREGWTFTPEVPKDPEAAFAMRYALVGPKGVYQIPAPKDAKSQ